MTSKENILHRQKLEKDGWLKPNGKILQIWVDNEYKISYYVVLFVKKGNEDMSSSVAIYCFRVYGGYDAGDSIHVQVSVSADQVIDVYPNGDKQILFSNNPNWEPAEGYDR